MNIASTAYRNGIRMSPDKWKKIDELLDQALDLPPDRHSAFLAEVCGDDEELRRELESLLAAHQKAGSFIETTPAEGMAAALAEQSLHSQTETMVGRTLGHYEITSVIGAGGMGEVYRARDKKLDRQVAIKVLPQHLSSHPEAISRFEREAKAVAALSHPNILAIHDFGHDGGATYAVMELLEGETLRARLDHSALNWREAVRIAASVADGLAAAHARGIIHRDIKPENVFLTSDGLVKILDFGIARVKKTVVSTADTLISQGFSETKPGTLMGTIGYMSPEQVRGESAEAPSDIFSLGCMLMEMLTGERPFLRPTAAETMAAILRDDPPSLDDLAQDIPVELERIARRCLEKSPEERFQSARDLALDLRSLLTSASGAYRPVSGAMSAYKAKAKRKLFRPLSLGIAALIGALLVVGYFWLRPNKTNKPLANSLAVIPLVNDSLDSNIEFLSDGIAETIVSNLAPLRPKLQVLASSSVRGYKGRQIDPRKVGSELGVRHVLVGRYFQQGNVLVISVELVDASDGTQLWSGRYQQQRADLMAIQDDISRQISQKLQINLTGDEQKLIVKRHTANSDAYYLYLNGRYFWNQRENDQLKKAIEFYERAISLDPNYALAYAGMADAYALLYDGGTERDDARRKAVTFAQKALSIDDNLAEPYATLGFIKTFRDWNWLEAESDFKRSLALNPGYATAHHWYALLLAIQGRFDAALDSIKRAREIDPRSFPINKDIGEILYYAHRYDEAVAQLRSTIESEPTNSKVGEAHLWIRNAYEHKGDLAAAINEMKLTSTPEEDIAELKQAAEKSGKDGYWRKRLELQVRTGKANEKDPTGRMRLMFGYAEIGDGEKAIPLLETAIKQDHHDGVLYLKVDPRFDNLRSHPRFPALLKLMNLAD